MSARFRTVIGVSIALSAAIALPGWMPQSAAADGTATVHGIVTAPGGGVPDAPVTVTLGTSTTTQTASDGRYSFTGVAAGQYNLVFDYTGTSTIVKHERWNGTFGSTNAGIVVADGESREVDVRLVAGASVSGPVTGIDGALDATTTIQLVWRGTGSAYSTPGTFDVVHQMWRVDDVPPGRYTVIVDPTARWQLQQWGYLTVTEGVDLVDTAHQLPRSTDIGGDVTYLDDGVTKPLPDGVAWAWNHSGGEVSAPIVAGRYDIYGLPGGGSYSVCFEEPGFVDMTCVGGGTIYDSPPVALGSNQVLDDVDLTVVRGGRILGALAGSGSPSWEARLLLRDPDTGVYGNELDAFPSSSTGSFAFTALVPGAYRLQLIDTTNTNNAQYWSGQRDAAQATDLVVTVGGTIDLGTITLSPWTIDTTRTDGIDRFAVSAGVSKALFPSVPAGGVPVIYVANGLNYPDALSAGPAAIKEGGGLLLVTPTSIPAPIAAELTRLRPQRIVVVGGPASVSDDVLRQLGAFVTGPSGVAQRQSGIDRFEASRNVTRSTFGAGGAPTVFIATGNNYPDALSAGPAAGSIGAPVILVDGLAPHLDADTMALLRDLHTTKVDIVGGPASVSFGIQLDLEALVGSDNLTIFGGETRYDNAAQLGATFFRYTDTVFFATGTNFPDALSASALAASNHAPIDLVEQNCVPGSVEYWIRAQQAQHVWLIGGPASLGAGVVNLTACSD